MDLTLPSTFVVDVPMYSDEYTKQKQIYFNQSNSNFENYNIIV